MFTVSILHLFLPKNSLLLCSLKLCIPNMHIKEKIFVTCKKKGPLTNINHANCHVFDLDSSVISTNVKNLFDVETCAWIYWVWFLRSYLNIILSKKELLHVIFFHLALFKMDIPWFGIKVIIFSADMVRFFYLLQIIIDGIHFQAGLSIVQMAEFRFRKMP